MTKFQSVYVRGAGSFLPNEPVDNDRMEDVLGLISGQRSRARRKILRSNGIKGRHYAIDPETGAFTHSNAQITAEAIRALVADHGLSLDDVECIASGTASPDQLMPNHASMVQGELGSRPCEVMTATGACLSGLTAMKYAALEVETGSARHAIATGSELTSAIMKASSFPNGETPAELLDDDPVFAFQQDFLRWMLSDGAAALWLSNEPGDGSTGPVLKVEWIDTVSYSGDMDTCMYWGGRKLEDGSFQGWTQAKSVDNAVADGMMNYTQDARLLGREVVRNVVERGLPHILERHPLAPEDVDWFLPHYSSEFFHKPIHESLRKIGFGLDESKWAPNLTTKGNTGSASVYLMLDDLLRSGNLKKGHRILGFVPESARFSVGYVLFTVQ